MRKFAIITSTTTQRDKKMTTAAQTLEMIQYWTAQQDSEQKEVVLAYWVKQAEKYTGNTATTAEKKAAFKGLAKRYGVPAKKAGETVQQQAHRLTYGKGHTVTWEQRLAASI